jgi:hypothetical protein
MYFAEKTIILTDLLERTRVVLSGSDDPGHSSPLHVIQRIDLAPPVAFLVSLATMHEAREHFVVPLIGTTNFIGKGAHCEHEWFRSPIVEGAQWTIDCTSTPAQVTDHWSTNGSVILYNSLWARDEPYPESLLFDEVLGVPGEGPVKNGAWLTPPWRNKQEYAWLELSKGDVLIGFYAYFIFGWMTAPICDPDLLGRIYRD